MKTGGNRARSPLTASEGSTSKPDPNRSDLVPAAEQPDDSLRLERDPWQWWREQMPIASRWAYLDHAAVAPLSGPAAEAIQAFAQEAAEQGDTVWPQWASNQNRLRQAIADLLSADRAEICIVPNTTTGINLVAEGWPWNAGESVVVPEGEFPSNLFPWLNQRVRGVEVRVVPRHRGEVRVDDLLDHVDESTRIIAVSWVGYASGYRLDLDDLVRRAHQRGVAVCLDAIQGLGVFPLDVSRTPVDFVIADGHKWLLGPEGAGVAMIRREHVPRLRCGNVGWASVKHSFNYADPSFDLRDDATRFESGSANLVGIAALAASVDLFARVRRAHGDQAIGDRVIEMTEWLDERLRDLGISTQLPAHRRHRSGILTFAVPGVDPAEVRRRALREKVVVSCRGGGVRASVHAYNDREDLERLVDVVRSCGSTSSRPNP